MGEQVADESVVVIKFEPEKSGNSMEDKTQMILHNYRHVRVAITDTYSKGNIGCEGMKLNLRCANDILKSQV